MQPIVVVAPWLTTALPFVAASITFFLAAQVRRIGSLVSKHHFEKLERESPLPSGKAGDPKELLNPTSALAQLRYGQTSGEIAKVYAKNGEGGDALIGMIALVSLTLSTGAVQSQLSGIFVGIGMGVAFLVAGLLWTRDATNYRAGWANVSITGWIYIGLNLLLAATFIAISLAQATPASSPTPVP